MSTGVSAVTSVTSGGMRVRIRLGWEVFQAWSWNIVRACLAEVLCHTAGEVN